MTTNKILRPRDMSRDPEVIALKRRLLEIRVARQDTKPADEKKRLAAIQAKQFASMVETSARQMNLLLTNRAAEKTRVRNLVVMIL